MSEPTRLFDVQITVTAKVPASNAGFSVEQLCEYVRQGLGPENARRWEAQIVHAEATCKSVFIPEKGQS